MPTQEGGLENASGLSQIPVAVPAKPATDPSSDDGWKKLIEAGPAPVRLTAQDFRRVIPVNSYSAPFVVGCDDGQEYVLKSPRTGPPGNGHTPEFLRSLITEQVVGWLGKKLGGPIPPVAIVDVSEEFIKLNDKTLINVRNGPSHGSLVVSGCKGAVNTGAKDWMTASAKLDENRSRLTSIAIIYGLFAASDPQLIYADAAPHEPWSVDHGHFLSGPGWSIASLGSLASATPMPAVVTDLQLTGDELRESLADLRAMSSADVGAAVRRPPDEWGVSMADRVALAACIWRRCREMIEFIEKLP